MKHYGICFHEFVRKAIHSAFRVAPGSRWSLTFVAMVDPATSNFGVVG